MDFSLIKIDMYAHKYAQALSGWMVCMKGGFNNGVMEVFQHYNGILIVFKLSK